MAAGMICFSVVFFFKQKTAYEMRISDWSSDVCSSDLIDLRQLAARGVDPILERAGAGQRPQILRVEIGALLVGVLQLTLARGELRIAETERFGRLGASASKIYTCETDIRRGEWRAR